MKIYECGNAENPVIFLFPGTCCQYTSFDHVLPLLSRKFFVNVVSYDGFDDSEDTVFPDMLEETARIEAYIQEHFNGRIFAAYGCSLGGSFVALLIGRENIHMEHGFIGSSDMDQAKKISAKIQAAIVTPIFGKILATGKLPGWMKKRLDKAPENQKAYMQTMMEKMFGIGKGGMPFIKKESIYNQFYSDLITEVGDHIDVEGTTVHVFYATKMGKKYEARYKQHFAHPDIRFHNLEHEELLCSYPEKWMEEICICCEMEGLK